MNDFSVCFCCRFDNRCTIFMRNLLKDFLFGFLTCETGINLFAGLCTGSFSSDLSGIPDMIVGSWSIYRILQDIFSASTIKFADLNVVSTRT